MGTELPGKSLYKMLWLDIADLQTDWYAGIYGQMTWVTLPSILDPISHLHETKSMSRLYTYSANGKNSDWKWERGHGLEKRIYAWSRHTLKAKKYNIFFIKQLLVYNILVAAYTVSV